MRSTKAAKWWQQSPAKRNCCKMLLPENREMQNQEAKALSKIYLLKPKSRFGEQPLIDHDMFDDMPEPVGQTSNSPMRISTRASPRMACNTTASPTVTPSKGTNSFVTMYQLSTYREDDPIYPADQCHRLGFDLFILTVIRHINASFLTSALIFSFSQLSSISMRVSSFYLPKQLVVIAYIEDVQMERFSETDGNR
ncbi:hypothetical protein L1887_10838 [Cichorium endivia]|nr:hypothetical protein L1887_10838 [Cichorium endivia]